MDKVADVIMYEGDNSTFVWKHPLENFYSMTQLIVHESQEAIFFMNGQALDLFGPGRYTLESQNIPRISRFLHRTIGDTTPFHCEVYFINKVEQMAIKWGTDSKVQYIDPMYGFALSIGASGEMSLKVDDSRKLLLKIVGTENAITQQALVSKFRGFLMTKVKPYIAQFMKNNKVSIFEIDENLGIFSDALRSQLEPDFLDYGLSLARFFITNVVKPDGEPQYERFKDIHFRNYADIAEAQIQQKTDIIRANTEAQRIVIESQALAAKRAQEGYTYQQERGFDVAQDVARNEAVGQFTNLGVGLGTMVGAGTSIGSTVGGMVGQAVGMALPGTKCPKCGADLPISAKFCPQCGEKILPNNTETIVCPHCGMTVVKGKFCPECGKPLSNKCPNCGKEVPSGGKFCPDCGTKIE